MDIKHFGVMLDCSRNGVLTVASVKRYIRILSRLGYNCLMLYTEDTYEIPGQPYFGYLRGRYSQAELKELDRYAAQMGIELIPCIQTLAHLNTVVRWNAYKPFTDTQDILLAGDERTYQLIEDMFRSLSECFTSRLVNIGMDEAQMVGLGKYLEQHGYENRFSILTKHLDRVCRIGQKYGFRCIMWSDMFFRLCNNGTYTCENPNIPGPEVTAAVPKSVELVYWNYYSDEKDRYDAMIKAHSCFENELWFAGGFWAWTGFAPKNYLSLRRTATALDALKENRIKNAFFTVWGDDGQECSTFAVLPALYDTAQRIKGISDTDAIKAGFQKEFGIAFDDFMLLDLPETAPHVEGKNGNPDKYMFYNDPFCGIFDSTVPEDFVPGYDACAEKLEKLAGHPEFGYLFDASAKLCRFLQVKFTLGIRTRRAYAAHDTAALAALISDYDLALALLEDFYQAHKARWFTENKPFGFEVQDVRIGGLKQRLIHCRERLQDCLSGKCPVIGELEEPILPEFAPAARHNYWCSQVTAGALGMDYIGR